MHVPTGYCVQFDEEDKAMTTTATYSTALSPGELKAQIVRIRLGFDRPLPAK